MSNQSISKPPTTTTTINAKRTSGNDGCFGIVLLMAGSLLALTAFFIFS